MTLIFSLAQAAACADAGASYLALCRPHPRLARQAEGKAFTPETDPGVLSLKQIYAYYKAYGMNTVVMGASFRNVGEIEALAGCDRLTISPQLLDALAADCRGVAAPLEPRRRRRARRRK